MRYGRLSDQAVLETFARLVTDDRTTTVAMLECLNEVDSRKLHLAAGHRSLFAWCVAVHHMSGSTAGNRIHAARAARRFPAILRAVADGRLHLTAVCLLAPYLAEDNVAELIAAATHRGKRQIAAWLGVRFAPPILLEAARPPCQTSPVALDLLATLGVAASVEKSGEHPPADVARAVDVRAAAAAPAVRPHSILHVALPPATQAKFERLQQLLAHTLPAGDVAAVLDHAFELALNQVERRKFAQVKKPRKPRAAGPLAPRTIPAAVKRAVVARDGERCAFVAPSGKRCSARSRLEFDHMDPVARGGLASSDRIRLLCRAHNQFEAERVFGREFMQRKREAARASRGALDRDATGQVLPAAPDPPG